VYLVTINLKIIASTHKLLSSNLTVKDSFFIRNSNKWKPSISFDQKSKPLTNVWYHLELIKCCTVIIIFASIEFFTKTLTFTTRKVVNIFNAVAVVVVMDVAMQLSLKA
jgi:hypothetical protein